MPARKKPVTKRKANKVAVLFANQIIETFARAASVDETKNTFVGSNLSAMEKIAKTSVPAMKPNCTMAVMLPIVLPCGLNSRWISGKIALPANHNDVPAN